MKIVKVRIRAGGSGENQLVYPTAYDAQEVDRDGFGPTALFGTSAYSGGVGRGEDEEWCLIALSDELAATYAVDKDMEIIDPSDADTLMEQWRVDNGESEIVVDDPDLLQALANKKTAGIELTADELKAFDSDEDDFPGLRKRVRSFAKVFSEKAPGTDLKDKAGSVIGSDGKVKVG